MSECEAEILRLCANFCSRVYAWCVLPNHYHVLLRTERIKELRSTIGQFHGRSAFEWNRADNRGGRKVWYNCFERPMKSERHFWATLNYVHNNPVHHGYVRRLARLAVVKCKGFPERVWTRKGKRDLVAVSSSGLRKEVGLIVSPDKLSLNSELLEFHSRDL